jgi:hypothetical protein
MKTVANHIYYMEHGERKFAVGKGGCSEISAYCHSVCIQVYKHWLLQ